jgi:predicted MFS family arabinose efflux permease
MNATLDDEDGSAVSLRDLIATPTGRLIAVGVPVLFVLAAAMLGAGQAGSIPASSHVMVRVTPPRLAAFAFSLKQTGVPVAAMAAGILVPLTAALSGWPTAFLAAAGFCALAAVALQPLRPALDRDRNAGAGAGTRAIWRR